MAPLKGGWEVVDARCWTMFIAMNEQHLRRLLRDYVTYYHHDRIHDSLAKDTPHQQHVEQRAAANAGVIAMPRLGGLRHRYTWREAA